MYLGTKWLSIQYGRPPCAFCNIMLYPLSVLFLLWAQNMAWFPGLAGADSWGQPDHTGCPAHALTSLLLHLLFPCALLRRGWWTLLAKYLDVTWASLLLFIQNVTTWCCPTLSSCIGSSCGLKKKRERRKYFLQEYFSKKMINFIQKGQNGKHKVFFFFFEKRANLKKFTYIQEDQTLLPHTLSLTLFFCLWE